MDRHKTARSRFLRKRACCNRSFNVPTRAIVCQEMAQPLQAVPFIKVTIYTIKNFISMNFFKKKTNDHHTRLIHKELSETIEQRDATLITKHLKTAQKIAAMDFKKLKVNSKIKDFLGAMKSDYQKLIDKIDQTLAGALNIFQSEHDINNAKDTIADYRRQIKDADDQLAFLKGKIDQAPEKVIVKVRNWTRQKVWILYFLAGFELMANFGVYFLLGGGMLSAISISLISAFVIFWWAHITPRYVSKFGGNSTRGQVLVFLLFAAPIFLIFYLFSKLRVESLILANPEMAEVFVSSPLVPTLINFFGYFIACYLVYNFLPSKEDINAYKKHRLDSKAIADLTHRREQLIQQKNAELPALQQKLKEHYNFLLLAQQLEQEVANCYEGCFEEFKSELYLRTNSACDTLFTGNKNDLPKLELKYHTINTKPFELCDDI